MNRRALLLGLSLPILAAGGALAQEQTARDQPATDQPVRPQQPRRQPRRQPAEDGAYMGGGMVLQTTPELGPRSFATNRLERAPVPNTNIEPPRGLPEVSGPRVTPGVIAPALPGRGLAQERGSPGSLQDRLFRPSPGAHLRIPLSW